MKRAGTGMCMKLIFRVQAIRRMAHRGISVADVRQVLQSGEIIEQYPDDVPYPSRLVLGFIDSRPIHVITADNPDSSETIVITTYEPDASHWDQSFRTRKNP